MAWNDAPPSKEELVGAPVAAAPQPKAAPSWDSAPPTPQELGQKPMGMLDYVKAHPEERDLDYQLGRTPESRALLAKGVGHVLDYPAGLMRTGLASVGGLVATGSPIVNEKDVTNAFKGQAPSSSEYLTRAGVPEGPSADLPFLGRVSPRGAAGLGLDVVTDPMTALAARGKLNPVGEALESAGQSTYKSGLKKVDERLAEKGAKPVSDLLLKEGKTGTTKTLSKDVAAIGDQALKERQALYDQVKQAGKKVDVGGVANGAKEKLSKMMEDPGLRPTAEKLNEMLDRYSAEGFIDIDKASDWKSNLYNALPESAYDAHGKVKGPVGQFQKALANDFKNAIIDTAEGAEKGLGKKIDALNETMQTTITAKKPMAMQVRRGETPNYVTSIDAILAHEPHILALKKAADLSKTTYARTKAGKGLIDIGKSGAAQGLVNRGLIDESKGLVNGQ